MKIRPTLFWFMNLFIVLYICALIIGVYHYLVIDPQSLAFTEKTTQVESELKLYRVLIRVTSNLPAIKNSFLVLTDRTQNTRSPQHDALEKTLVEIAFQDPKVQQIRLLDLNGQELLQIDQSSTGIKVINPTELGTISNRVYFQKALTLNKDEVYTSEVSLIQEKNKPVFPYEPTIRFTTPIFSSATNQKVGVLVINIFARELFQPLTAAYGKSLIIFDETGNYLHHYDSTKEFGDQLDTQQNFFSDKNNEKESYYRRLDEASYFFPGLFKYRFARKIRYDVNDPNRYWIVIVENPRLK